MPKIDLSKRSVPSVADLRDVVIICTTVERPDGNVSTIVERPGVIRVHARIRDLKPEVILNYQAVALSQRSGGMGSQFTPSKSITIRTPPDVKVDLNHWVYQETGYAKVWYKVRAVEDLGGVGRWLEMYCSVETLNDERSDPATQESPPRWEPPDFPVVDRI